MIAIKTNFEVSGLSVEGKLSDAYLASDARYVKVPANKGLDYLGVSGVTITTAIVDMLNGNLGGAEHLEVEAMLIANSDKEEGEFYAAMYRLSNFFSRNSANQFVA